MSLAARFPIEFGTRHFNVTAIIVGPVCFVSVVTYATVLGNSPAHDSSDPFSEFLLYQLCCVFAALVYAFYVATSTRFFEVSVSDG